MSQRRTVLLAIAAVILAAPNVSRAQKQDEKVARIGYLSAPRPRPTGAGSLRSTKGCSAKALGITVPQTILVRADRVIE